MPGSRTAIRSRSRSVPVMFRYASGIRRPVHAAVSPRLAPAIRRTSITVSGSSHAPTTASVPMAVMSRTVMKSHTPNAIAAATNRCTVAHAARWTVFHMPQN